MKMIWKVKRKKWKQEWENLTQEDLAKAEQAVIQHAQQQKCKTEMALISNGLKAGSKGKFSLQARPGIGCRGINVLTLILRHFRQNLAHVGRAYILSKLRQKDWIVNANSAAKKIISCCIMCTRNKEKFVEQKMAQRESCQTWLRSQMLEWSIRTKSL